jgi:hypothetical protein
VTTAELLRQARERYAGAPDHTPRGEFPRCGYCAATALGTDGGPEIRAAEKALAEAAGLDTGDIHWGARGAIIEWNAKASTAEVLAAFDRAIANA